MLLTINQLGAVIALLFLSSLSLVAQTEATELNIPKKVYNTIAVKGEAPDIDGDLSDAAWNDVAWSSGYVEFQPDVGTEPTQQTK